MALSIAVEFVHQWPYEACGAATEKVHNYKFITRVQHYSSVSQQAYD